MLVIFILYIYIYIIGYTLDVRVCYFMHARVYGLLVFAYIHTEKSAVAQWLEQLGAN